MNAREYLEKLAEGFTPPAAARSNAAHALEMRRQHHRGGLSTAEAHQQGIGSGVARASSLAGGGSIPLATVKRMHAYFSRHAVDKNAQGFRQGEPGYPSAGRIAWDLWGGDAGKAWADGIVGRTKEASGHNEPTNPALWARAISAAKRKFDVYPSAYANGWATKWYEQRGGGWRKEHA